MEAPKKIYIMPHTLTDGFLHRWFEEPFKRECIEYILKDAFIEKACEYFAPYLKDNSGGYERAFVFENFKKYIKEE